MILNYGASTLNIEPKEESYRYRQIMGENTLTLHFAMPDFLELPVGTWCMFEGQRYELKSPSEFTKNGTRKFDYTLVMRTEQDDMSKYKLRHPVTKKLKFSFMGTPAEHLALIVENMNMRESGWAAGTVIDATQKLISYNHTYCSEALQTIANDFETEYEIINKVISLCKVEHDMDNPVALAYRSGIKPGTGRSNYDDDKKVEVLHVQGGDRNIDVTAYGSPELLLPTSQALIYEGRTYVVDSQGYSIRRSDVSLTTGAEDSLDCSHIYPQRVGTVSSVIVIDAAKNLYDISDVSIPADLDYELCLIDGQTMTVMFQTGILTGKEFEAKYSHADRRFELVPFQFEGAWYPNSVWTPIVGDKYSVYNIMLPSAYIRDDATQSGASWDMFREAARYMYEHEGEPFTFNGTLDPIWSKSNWGAIAPRIRPGGYVAFSDSQFQTDPVLIRLTAVRDFVRRPYEPEIELSNKAIGSTVASQLQQIDNNKEKNDYEIGRALNYTNRRWQDIIEAMNILQQNIEYFGDEFNGQQLTIQTIQGIFGSKLLQVQFLDNLTNRNSIDPTLNAWDDETKMLNIPACVMQHMTLGIEAISPTHANDEYHYWQMSALINATMPDMDKIYYLYAVVNRSATVGGLDATTTGTFQLLETMHEFESDVSNYYVWLGFFGRQRANIRSFTRLYGFTEILPGQIITDIIKSQSGNVFINLAQEIFNFGNGNNYVKFNNQTGLYEFKGIMVVSPSGSSAPLPVWRGAWTPTATYFRGDLISYDGQVYLMNPDSASVTQSTGDVPDSNPSIWKLWSAKGADGADGASPDWKTFAYRKWDTSQTAPNDKPAKPTTSTQSIPPGWSDYPDSIAEDPYAWFMSVAIAHWTGSAWSFGGWSGTTWVPGQWSEVVQVSGAAGTEGDFTKFLFKASPDMSSPTWNGTLANMLVPTGWLEQPPTMPVGGSIWMISAILSNGGQTIVQQWSTPVRISGEKGESGSSPYMLDLSNENATVTATYAGVVEGAYPVCEAALYLGSSTVSPGLAAGNVTFRYSPTGCSIFIPNGIGTILSGNNSGWIAYTRFALNGGFNGDTATVTVEARTDGVVRDTKIMNISKAKGGADGTPATVFWLSLSNDVFKVSKTGVISPSQITIKALKQTGSDAVVEIPTGFGSYGLSLRRGGTLSDGSTFDVPYSLIVIQSDLVTADMTSMNVKLLLNGVVIDIETIPIVRDGEDGNAGDSGQPGPGIAFKGIWSSGAQYNVLTQNIGGVNVPIIRDVVKRNTVYYVALQSSLNRPPESNPDYWIAYNSFANIATGILLAEEAVIAGWKFAPGNSNYPQSGYFYSMGNQVIFDGRNVSDGNAGDGVSAGTSLPSNPNINDNYANFFPRAAFGASNFANRKSAPLRLYENGLIYTEKLHAKQGRVGNFNITDQNLYTDAGLYLNNDSILFNGTNITARFGTRVSSGYVFPLMQFLEDTTTNYSDQAVGIMINMPNRRYNRAIHVNAGDIASKGDVYSFGVSKLVVPSNTLWQLDQYMYHTTTYNTSNYPTSFRFLCEYGSANSGLLLPSRDYLLDKLGRDKTSSYDSIMVEIVFVSAVWTAATGQIWGRNPNTNSGQNNTTAYPQIIDNSGNNANSVSHSKGRILKFMLHYQDTSNYYAYFMISN